LLYLFSGLIASSGLLLLWSNFKIILNY
jgi:hypothetical protein